MTQPPGTGTLGEQLAALRRQVAELSRKSPAMPACRAALSASVALSSRGSSAPGTWLAREDPLGWFTAASPSCITIGLDGYYQLCYHSSTGGLVSGANAASKILRNGTVVNANSIASDLVVSSAASEGCIQNCFRARVPLAAGDKIYWNNYVSAAGATLAATSFTIPTEVTVQSPSPRAHRAAGTYCLAPSRQHPRRRLSPDPR
ncbi:hypothetical protein AB0F91_45675 [Amycolatopsis sp. NPDC023774]|uniref:hypothetical protein n=1 Tax=Amycolatopsis sp. NPDC023774 TaxID=3155015 RepID=UPI0033CDC84C